MEKDIKPQTKITSTSEGHAKHPLAGTFFLQYKSSSLPSDLYKNYYSIINRRFSIRSRDSLSLIIPNYYKIGRVVTYVHKSNFSVKQKVV